MTFAQRLDRTIYTFSRILLILGTVAILFMAAHVIADVIGRLTSSRPIYGTTEIVSYYYMVAIVCLPLAYLELRDEHITVDIFYLQMPMWLKRCVFVFACLVTAGFFTLFAYQSWLDSLRAMAVRDAVAGAAMIEIWPSRFFMPLGFALLVIAALLRAAKALMLPGPPEGGDQQETL